MKNLRKALATFAGTGDDGRSGGGGDTDPAKPDEELLDDLCEAIALVEGFLKDRNASLDVTSGQKWTHLPAIIGPT